jgi:amino acid transporter
MATEAELAGAKENLRDSFLALALAPDNRKAAQQADTALRELDRLFDGGQPTLRQSLSTPKIVVLVIAAAAPLAAMVGTVPLAFADGNGPGVPGMFAVAGIVLLCFSVGYAAMSRRIVNAGGFYTYLSCGLGKPVALGGGLLAVLSYNAVCVGLIGAFGYFLHLGLAQSGISIPWQVFAAIALAASGLLGYRKIDVSARVLRVLMYAEIMVLLVLTVFVIARRGAAAVPLTSFAPRTVLGGAVGVTMMFAFSAFIGFESAALYGEEAHNPRRSVPLATYASVIVISVFYAFTSWVAVGAVGPAHLRSVARRELGNLFFMISDDFASPALTLVMQLLLVTSLFAAILALHNATNRYMFVLGRERVLPGWLGQVHSRHASPHHASLVQTSINVVVITVFAAAGLNPYTSLATSMIGLGTLGIVALQAATSVAVIGFFRNRAGRHWWRTFGAPGLGAAGLITAVILLVRNFGVLTGTHNVVVSALPWLLPAAVACGVGYALWLRRSHPERYAGLAATKIRD